LEAKEISVLKFKVVLKERCQDDSVTAAKIYSEEQSKLAKQFNFTNPDLAKYAPNYRRMASCLQKRRAKTRPKLPTDITEIKLVDVKFTATSNGLSKFLIYNTKNNKILLFCSPDGLTCLSESNCWHSDGTFHVAAN
jgi:hypothetical protein